MIFGRVIMRLNVKKADCVRVCIIIIIIPKNSLDESEVCVLWKFLILEENWPRFCRLCEWPLGSAGTMFF